MVHAISLYELCSKRYLDLEVQPGHLKNEFQAICNLMDRYAYGGLPIFIADRGFSSYNVFAHAIENKVDFLIRAKDLNVQRFLGVETLPDKLDTTVELILTRTQSKKKHKHPEKASQYRFIYKNSGDSPSYVKKAFELAYGMLKAYNVQDKVTLFYNDYNTYFGIQKTLNLVEFINKDEPEKICGGIGMQSHVDVKVLTIELYSAALEKFLAVGYFFTKVKILPLKVKLIRSNSIAFSL